MFLAGLVAGFSTTEAVAQSNAAAGSDGLAPTEEVALAEAKSSGQRTEVTAFRSETRTVYANPDATFTAVVSVQPVRVFQGDRWATPDTTLVRDSDGTVQPKAAAVGMRFSGGGTGAFAQMERLGRKLSLSLPGKLPEPSLAGNTATYKDVLPGVDLVVNAEIEGFSHVFRVNTAEAARNPQVAKLELGLRTDRVKAQATAEGGLDLVDTAAGGAVFEAPQPVMWDSSKPAAQSAANNTAGRLSRSSEPPGSVELREGPAETSRKAEVKVGLGNGKVTLTPDPALLSDPKTEFPVYIDPVYKTSRRSGWTMVSSGLPTTEFWGFPGKDNEGMGECPVTAGDVYNCNGVGVKRLFYAIPTSAFKGKTIISAEFAVTLRHTYYNAGSNPRAVDLHWTASGIGKSTNWNNQPGGLHHLQTKSPTNPASSCTSTNQNVRFNAKAAVEADLSTTTFRLAADVQSDHTYWKRWCENAQLEVNYNSPPRAPVQSKLAMSNPGGPCRTGTGRPYLDAGTPTLLANEGALTDPDHTSKRTEWLRAKFKVAWTPSGGTRVEKTLENGNKASGSKFSVALPSSWAIPENVVVTWQVQAADIRDGAVFSWGPWSGACEFVVDRTAPKKPVITSLEYPDDLQSYDGAGSSGEFTFDSPSTDVVEYRYGFNGDAPENNIVKPISPGGPVTIPFTPIDEGRNWVVVEAVDSARKSSGDTHEFMVAGGRAPRAHWTLNDPAGSDVVTAATTGIPVDLARGTTLGVAGKAGTALSFDGGPYGYGETDFPVVRTDQSFTVAAWVKLRNDDYKFNALAQDGTQQSGFQLGVDDKQGWVFKMPSVDGPNGGGPWNFANVGSPAPLNTWAHLVGVYDATAKQIRLYVDGRRAAVRDNTVGWDSRGSLQFGRSLFNGAYHNGWQGDIDDVKVLQSAASDEDAGTLFGGQTPSSGRLLAHWTLDEPAKAWRIYDQNADLKANVTGAAALGSEGRFASSIGVDGIAQYASTASRLVDPKKSYSVSVWAKPVQGTGRWGTVAAQEGARMSSFLIEQMPSGNWAFSAWPTDTDDSPVSRAQSTEPVNADRWTHLVGVHDAKEKTLKLYVNGSLQATVPHDASRWVSITENPFVIGAGKWQGNRSGFFLGAIDDVRVFDRVVVPKEVHDFYWGPPKRMGYWPLNEAPGNLSPEKSGGKPLSLAGDASIYTNPDPIFGDPALVGDGHLQLNGTGTDGAATTDSVIRTDASYTVTARARLAAVRPGRDMTVVSQAGVNRPGFRLRYNQSLDRWQVGFIHADTPEAEVTWLSYSEDVPSADASGQHLAIVYDDFRGEVRLIVDGQEIDSARTAFRSTWNAAGQFQVGRGLVGTTPNEHFSGAIDDVRAYSGVLGETELQQLANPQEQPDL